MRFIRAKLRLAVYGGKLNDLSDGCTHRGTIFVFRLLSASEDDGNGVNELIATFTSMDELLSGAFALITL